MREILFRGESVDTQEWVYGAYCGIDCDNMFGPSIARANIIRYDRPFEGYWVEVDPKTVGKYTGLKDKNGRMIFEDDIVIGENYLFPVYDNRKLKIYWDEKTCGFQMNVFNMDDIEVIGNIYDNPELLD